ncbi:MAG: LacI family transcriptional regulator [Anaerolineae bacterium]|nr:LacI family transcriptional regulator [Anaerolineae bacterium]
MNKKSLTKLRPPTMYDVAKLAGVSQPTVSRVLNQNDTTVQISDDTRQRVLDAVERLGYRPNVIARSLRTQRSQMIALLIADISNGFYHPMTRAIQDVARRHDYEVLISNSDHLYQNEKHFCEVVSRRSMDGVIMVPIHLTSEDIGHFIAETNMPTALLADHINHPDIDNVYVNDERATYEAISWMIEERGYTHIGYIGVGDDFPPGPRRFKGFMQAMGEHNLAADLRFMFNGDFTRESGVEIAHRLLQVGDLPRALFVVNDLMAIGVILTLQEAGYRVPEDIAIMGFDNIPEATIVRPTLTTIAQDPRDLGLKLAESLFSRIENPTLPSRIVEGSYQIIIRNSA